MYWLCSSGLTHIWTGFVHRFCGSSFTDLCCSAVCISFSIHGSADPSHSPVPSSFVIHQSLNQVRIVGSMSKTVCTTICRSMIYLGQQVLLSTRGYLTKTISHIWKNLQKCCSPPPWLPINVHWHDKTSISLLLYYVKWHNLQTPSGT
jgi:hypothetical protein